MEGPDLAIGNLVEDPDRASVRVSYREAMALGPLEPRTQGGRCGGPSSSQSFWGLQDMPRDVHPHGRCCLTIGGWGDRGHSSFYLKRWRPVGLTELALNRLKKEAEAFYSDSGRGGALC